MVQLGVHRGLRLSQIRLRQTKTLSAHSVLTRSFAGEMTLPIVLCLVPDGVDGLADGSIQNELLLPAVRDDGGFATVRGFQGPSEWSPCIR